MNRKSKARFAVNKKTSESRLRVNVTTKVNRADIRKESRDGVDHIVMTSYTLPEDVVMNGGLYSKEERDKAFMTLDRKLAPIEHPTNSSGQYISANDPDAIHNFHAGAFNENPRIDGKRIAIDKVINVQQALKSDKGKRLLDRINDMLEGNNTKPIHTSVGLFVDIEELSEPMTNADGDQYDWIAKNMYFDHDAILLDSIGAATPEQGVGMGVNTNGKKLNVSTFVLDQDDERPEALDLRTNKDLSFDEIYRKLYEALEANEISGYVVEVYEEYFIHSLEGSQSYYKRGYSISGGSVTISREALEVERVTEYKPVGGDAGSIKNEDEEGEAMLKTELIKLLLANGIKVSDDATDAELVELVNNMSQKASQDDAGDQSSTSDLQDAIAGAIEPLVNKVNALETKLTEKADSERAEMVELVTNSSKAKEMGLTEDDVKAMPESALRKFAANCKTAHGMPMGGHFANNSTAWETTAEDLPE